ncbi:hypothetical protein ABFT93_18790 [Xanthomonas campestris pv. campestris]
MLEHGQHRDRVVGAAHGLAADRQHPLAAALQTDRGDDAAVGILQHGMVGDLGRLAQTNDRALGLLLLALVALGLGIAGHGVLDAGNGRPF